MKNRRFLFTLVLLVLLLPTLVITASAKGGAVVSEDYTTVTYDGNTYVRVNGDDVTTANDADNVYDITFEGTDKDSVSDALLYANDAAIELTVYYKSGGCGSYVYVRDDLLDEYTDFLKNGGDSYEISVYHGLVNADSEEIFGQKLIFKGYELNYYDLIGEVDTTGLNGTISSWRRGYVFRDTGNSFYYVDYYQFGEELTYNELTMKDSVTVWKITDADTVEEIELYLDEFFYDIGYDDDTFEDGEMFVPGLIILAIALGLLPLAAGIVTFIISRKADTPYKQYLRAVSICCLAAFVVTVVTIIICIILA